MLLGSGGVEYRFGLLVYRYLSVANGPQLLGCVAAWLRPSLPSSTWKFSLQPVIFIPPSKLKCTVFIDLCVAGQLTDVVVRLALSVCCVPPHPPASTGTYQGCFHHSWSEIELANIPVIDYSLASRESCHGHCSAAGFKYYALEFGFMCSCGGKLPPESSMATDADCSLVRQTPEKRRSRGVVVIRRRKL